MYFPVNSRKVETLGDFVRRVRTGKGLSTTDVETASRHGGFKGISDAYVTQIENGHVTNVSPEKLRALAKGLDINEDEIFAIARGKQITEAQQHDAEIERLIKHFREVPRECQLDMLALTESLWLRRRVEGRAERMANRRERDRDRDKEAA